jgi:hypothetical protein
MRLPLSKSPLFFYICIAKYTIMTSTQLKSNLHQLIDNSKNSRLLTVVHELLASDKINANTLDWWDTLNPEQKQEIEVALKELQSGKGIAHKAVMSKYKGKYC